MQIKKLALSLLLLFFLSSCGKRYVTPPSEIAVPTLDEQFDKCTATKAGEEYVNTSSVMFLKAAKLPNCILKGEPVHAPALIYFKVDSLGVVSDVVVKPTSLLTYCIKEHVAGLSISPPPENECVVRIVLKFEDSPE